MSFLRIAARRAALPRYPSVVRQLSTTAPRADIARVQIIGNVGTEPEISTTANGEPMIRYSVASSHGSADGQRTTQWHKVYVFGESTTTLTKGTRVFLDGDLRISSYEGEDGKKHNAVTIRQRSVNILSRPRVKEGEGESHGSQE
ncbi:hypothetical protein DRE_03010 [Drechslerella stenobrocha 248]|uniref:Single-stranded DNA-binding protein RIM1 n=1 Tax=Drechslerella stenobrocha 248 TaxID=1043628 RepID=W7IFB9_9PEZI|nr:hypothetical protein DRE_03010 [Drechslerella stenobrocha 248]